MGSESISSHLLFTSFGVYVVMLCKFQKLMFLSDKLRVHKFATVWMGVHYPGLLLII